MPVRDRVRRFLQKPGTADLNRLRRLLPAIGAREEALRQVPDGELALLSGYVAEMATGEGKTLSGALAAAGHALRGHRVHVMSVNDYLARRDAGWMRPVYQMLGVSCGCI